MKWIIPAGEMDKIISDFHWLKVKFRCIYKLLVIVYNCIHNRAPNEIMSLLQYADSDRTMNLREVRSSSKYGGKAFSRVGPKMWNLLPRTVRDVVDALEFKKALKSFLMTRGDEYCHWLTRKWLIFRNIYWLTIELLYLWFVARLSVQQSTDCRST